MKRGAASHVGDRIVAELGHGHQKYTNVSGANICTPTPARLQDLASHNFAIPCNRAEIVVPSTALEPPS
eukprot:438274-Pleurochrysis_carterae.AAC.1